MQARSSIELPDPLARTDAELLRVAGAENFPVAPWFLPRRERAALLALYGYARLVDDIGDEPGLGSPQERLALLDAVDADLDRLFAGAPPRLPAVAALVAPVAAHALPPNPFSALVEANRWDQRRRSYADWDELLGYCALSAAPVGELVLRVFASATPERLAWSQSVCAGLQVVEHLQDMAEDCARGRVYLPASELTPVGLSMEQLLRPEAGAALVRVVESVAAQARALLGPGQPLVASLRGRPRLAVAAFVAGGHAAVDGVRRAGPSLAAGSPGIARADLVRHALLVLTARTGWH